MVDLNKKKKEVFTVNVDGQKVELAVEKPNQKHLSEAQKVYNRVYYEAIESGAIVRPKVESIMRSQNLWNDDMKKEADEILQKIMDHEQKIIRGGVRLSQGKIMSLELRELRDRQLNLLRKRNELDGNTAEAQAESARFNKLVSLCTVYNDTGEQFFSNYDDYIEKSDEPSSVTAATRLAFIVHNLDPNYEQNLPENKFLKQWKMVDDKLRLINKDGHLIDLEGRLIDEERRFVNGKGEYVDRNGQVVDNQGNYVSNETQPFLDEDGNPLPA